MTPLPKGATRAGDFPLSKFNVVERVYYIRNGTPHEIVKAVVKSSGIYPEGSKNDYPIHPNLWIFQNYFWAFAACLKLDKGELKP